MKTIGSELKLKFANRMIAVIGVVFFLMGSVFYWVFTQSSVELDCDRARGDCVLLSQGPLSSEVHQIELADIRGAEVETRRQRDSDGVSITHQAVLNTARGSFSLSSYSSSSRGGHDALASQVNDFLAHQAQTGTLQLQHAPAGWLHLLLLLFPLIGLGLILGVRNVAEVEAMPGAGLLVLRKRRWWQSAGKEETLPLAEVEGVDVETSVSRSSRGGTSRTHRCVLCLKSGERKPLFGFSTGGKGAFKRAEQLREWLGRVQPS